VGGVNNNQNNLAIGKSGDIQITTDQLSLTYGAQLSASTLGQGNAGNVIINATKSVSLDGSGSDVFSGVGAPNNTQNNLVKGNGGNIQITTDQLSLTNGAQLAAITYGQGNAGNVMINATKGVSLDGQAAILSDVGGVNNNQNNLAIGKSGDIQITTDQLSLTNGAQLAADTFGQGNAGNVIINATKSVSLDGSGSVVFSDVGAVNNTQNNLVKGNGGNIQITTDQLSLTNGAVLTASTLGQGNAGNVIINATKSVSLEGRGSGVFSTVGAVNNTQNNLAVGKGGDIQITTDQLSLSNGAFLTADDFGQGDAGNLEITDRSTRLDHGLIDALTNSGNGGNITLTPQDLLLLRNGSQISTTAGIPPAGGNGGNITINSKFIIAIPQENSDITANAFTGKGGSVQINTQGIFGIQYRPQLTDESDITASSIFGVSGIVNINTPDTSSLQNSLTQLPQNLINPNTLIANSCIARSRKQQGTFTITGSGGVPNRPRDTSVSSYPTGTVRNVQGDSASRPWHKGDTIVEPQSVYQLPNGHLVLSRECS